MKINNPYAPTNFLSRIFDNAKKRAANIAQNPSSMLVHTGALGWAASSAAQITGMAFNDKIDTNKKKFLIPQEFADAAGNIALYYAVTIALKHTVEDIFEYGRIRFEKVDEALEKKAKSLGCKMKDLFEIDKGMTKALEDLPEAKKYFLSRKNGASIVAAIIGSIISCNILTPYLRNFIASKVQDRAIKRAEEANTKIFDMTVKTRCKVNQSPIFADFIV